MYINLSNVMQLQYLSCFVCYFLGREFQTTNQMFMATHGPIVLRIIIADLHKGWQWLLQQIMHQSK